MANDGNCWFKAWLIDGAPKVCMRSFCWDDSRIPSFFMTRVASVGSCSVEETCGRDLPLAVCCIKLLNHVETMIMHADEDVTHWYFGWLRDGFNMLICIIHLTTFLAPFCVAGWVR